MKEFRQISMVLLAAAMMCSCWQDHLNQITTYGTVGSYVSINRNNQKYDHNGNLAYNVLNVTQTEADGVVITASIFGRTIADIISHALGEDNGAYQMCVDKFGDYNPNVVHITCANLNVPWEVRNVYPPLGRYRCAYDTICSIDIRSNQSWGAEHPAGASLNGLFTAHLRTPYPYIQNGWKGDVLTTVSKPVSQLTADDMTLLQIESGDINTNGEELYSDITFSTTSRPTTRGTHTIFVTLTLDTGEQIEYSTDYTFE